jgi:hypothetical protein
MFLPLAAFAAFIYFACRRQFKRLLTETSLVSAELTFSRRPKIHELLHLFPGRNFSHA